MLFMMIQTLIEYVPDYFITDNICDQVEEKLKNVICSV